MHVGRQTVVRQFSRRRASLYRLSPRRQPVSAFLVSFLFLTAASQQRRPIDANKPKGCPSHSFLLHFSLRRLLWPARWGGQSFLPRQQTGLLSSLLSFKKGLLEINRCCLRAVAWQGHQDFILLGINKDCGLLA